MTVVVKKWNYTGVPGTFVVPPFVTSARFEVWGAAGGSCTNYGLSEGYHDFNATRAPSGSAYSNPGGYAAGTLAVNPGDTYNVYVGGNGFAGQRWNALNVGVGTIRGGAGGWNGGGAGGQGYRPLTGSYVTAPAGGGGGGGGATDIRYNGTTTAARILVAGGAGGAGGAFPASVGAGIVGISSNPATPAPPYGYPVPGKSTRYISRGYGVGGYGGVRGATGTGGVNKIGTLYQPENGGIGATSAADGTAGQYDNFGNNGSGGGVASPPTGAGVAGQGGYGGPANSATDAATNGVTCGGGGGGGGYFAGGGGSTGFGISITAPATGGGGGGGSNYVGGSFTATVNKSHAYPPYAGGASGLGGFAQITYTQVPDTPVIEAPLNNATFDPSLPLSIMFDFASQDDTAYCIGYDVEWRVSAGVYAVIHVAPVANTSSYTYTFPAAFFTAGNSYDIGVRVYDQNKDVSAYQVITLSAVTPPTAPTITGPTANQVLGTNTVTVTWTNGSGLAETAYDIAFNDTDGNLLFDSGLVNAASRVNLCPNPSGEVDTSSWSVTNGTLSISTTGPSGRVGANSIKVAWNTSTLEDYSSKLWIPIATTPGMPYTFSVLMNVVVGSVIPLTIAAQNPSDALPFVYGDTTPYTTGTYTPSVSFIAESSVTWLVLIPFAGYVNGSFSTYIDNVLCELDGVGTPRLYFDGSNLNGNTGTVSWVGTAGKSVSRLTTTDVLTYTYTYPPGSSVHDSLDLRIANLASNGTLSNPAHRVFSINVQPAAPSTVTVTADPDNGCIRLHMVAGLAVGGTYWATAYWDIFRTDPRTGVEKRIATGVLPSLPDGGSADYYDRSALTEVAYTYRVRAYTSGGGYSDNT